MSKQKKGCEVGACREESRGHVYTRARSMFWVFYSRAMEAGRARAEREMKGPAGAGARAQMCMRARAPSGCLLQ